MTGYPNYNYAEFARLAPEWEARRWAVHNPATAFNGSEELPYESYMHSAVTMLLQADAIALMEGWEKSRGATMEALIAQRLGLPFYNANTGRRMQVDTMWIVPPKVLEPGSQSFAPNGEIINALVPIAQVLAAANPENGITMSDIREAGLSQGILTGEEHPNQLSALSAVPKQAGLVSPRGAYRKATTPGARGRAQKVYYAVPVGL